MARYLVGIDNGGTMSKAAVFTSGGRELAAASRKVEIIEPHHGWSERDLDADWRGTAEAVREAIERAAGVRLRPILMTTAAMVLGVLPLVFAKGAGAESRYSMGLVIATGMSIGTFFTLFVVPVFYTFIAADRRPRAPALQPKPAQH